MSFSKNFCCLPTHEVISTDLVMRDAISWDPCGGGDEMEFPVITFGKILRFLRQDRQ